MLESKFQAGLIKELKERFPGCIVLKNDPNYIQGIPDLTVLYKEKWALLETKQSGKAPHRPNQDYYISEGDKLSFLFFISLYYNLFVYLQKYPDMGLFGY